MRRTVGGEAFGPGLLDCGAARAGVPTRGYRLRNDKRRMCPAQRRARRGNFLLAKCRAVHVGRSGLVRGALADDRAAAEELRSAMPRAIGPGRNDCRVDGGDIMAVDSRMNPPAIGLETSWRVVGEPVLGLAVDRDPVVVVEHDELAETPRAGKRRGLMGDSLHQAAVANECECVVIDDVVARAIEFARQKPFCERHPDRVGETLSQRARGGLDARRDAALRVPGRLRVELAKAPDLVDRQIVAGEVQQAVEQHGSMAVRKHEAIAIGPRRMCRVMAEMRPPQGERDFRHAHRHSGVSRSCRFDRVHRECAQRVGELVVGGGGRRGGGHVCGRGHWEGFRRARVTRTRAKT